MQPDSRVFVPMLALIVATGQFSTSLYLPSVPAIAEALGASRFEIGLTMSLFLAAFGISQLIYGPLSDRFGRRPVLLGGLALFALSGAGLALAQSIEALIWLRVLQAVGACSGQVIARAVVRDVVEGTAAARLFSVVAMAVALAPPVAQIIGGQIETWFGWRAGFGFLGFYGIAALLAVWWLMGETNRHRDPSAANIGRMVRNIGYLLRDRRFLGMALALGGCFGGLYAYITEGPHILIGMIGLSPSTFGLLALVNIIGFFLGSWLARRYAESWGPEGMVARGAVLSAIGGLTMLGFALSGPPTIPGIIIPVFLLLLGMGLVMPGAMTVALQEYPLIAGTASALLGVCQMEMGMLGSLAASALAESGVLGDGHLPMAVVFAVMGNVVLVSWGLLARKPVERTA